MPLDWGRSVPQPGLPTCPPVLFEALDEEPERSPGAMRMPVELTKATCEKKSVGTEHPGPSPAGGRTVPQRRLPTGPLEHPGPSPAGGRTVPQR